MSLDSATVAAGRWTRLWLPDKTSEGWILTFYERRIPILVDRSGAIVHSWPHVRGGERVRLTSTGTILLLGLDNAVREYDSHGGLVWEYFRVGQDFPHHDLRRLSGGTTLLIYRNAEDGTDYLLEVNRQGDTVWQWRSQGYLESHFAGKVPDGSDKTHFNSIQELPENRWYEAGDRRFARAISLCPPGM